MKPFKTIDEQLDILKSRGLNIDLENTNEILFREGYYNIINGYKDIFIDDKYLETFVDSTSFSDIYMLYYFDKLLRDCIFNVCVNIENIIKNVIAYQISDAYGICERVYLDRSRYRSGIKMPSRNGDIYEIDAVINSLKHLINSGDEPYKHYKNEHGHVPAWILLKGTKFWVIKTFLKLQKSDVKNKIASNLLNKDLDCISEDDKQFLSDIVHIIYKFRNYAAHGGRMYNLNIRTRKSKKDSDLIKYYKPFHDKINISKDQYNLGYGQSDFYAFYFAAKELLSDRDYSVFNRSIIKLLKAIKNDYNDKYITILKMMGIPEHMLHMEEDEIFV